MFRAQTIIISLFLLLFHAFAYSEIVGKVNVRFIIKLSDEYGNPASDIRIAIKGHEAETTDENGECEFMAPTGTDIEPSFPELHGYYPIKTSKTFIISPDTPNPEIIISWMEIAERIYVAAEESQKEKDNQSRNLYNNAEGYITRIKKEHWDSKYHNLYGLLCLGQSKNSEAYNHFMEARHLDSKNIKYIFNIARAAYLLWQDEDEEYYLTNAKRCEGYLRHNKVRENQFSAEELEFLDEVSKAEHQKNQSKQGGGKSQ